MLRVVAFDTKSQLPAVFVDVIKLPIFDAFGNASREMEILSAMELSKIDQKTNIKAPAENKKMLSLEAVSELLNINLD